MVKKSPDDPLVVFIEHPNNVANSQVMVDEEITDCDGSFAFWIEIGSIFRQRESLSSEPKSFLGDGYELRFRHRSPDVLSLTEQEIYHREPTGSIGL